MIKLAKKIDLKIIFSACLITAVIIVAFLPCLKNGFVNWDDGIYVTNNPVIQKISPENIRHIFGSFFISNYQPFTILSYLCEYHFFGSAPYGYHLISLILHLLNACLVFWLVYLLSRKTGVSVITALLFAVHPLHVESVAWISERKDVLYALFFLASLIGYLYSLRTPKPGKYYCLSLILFIFSLLSKAMAITLPAVLLSIDYLTGRKPDKKMFVEKIPFFVLSCVFSVIAVLGQYSSGAMRENITGALDKLAVAAYSIAFYLTKIFMPVKLACLYPRMEARLSPELLVLPALYLILCIGLFLSARYRKKAVFGNAYFLITVLPVLQFVPIGETLVADRYVYLPALGIFYLVAEFLVGLIQDTPKLKRTAGRILLVFLTCALGAMVLLTRQRCGTWKDSLTLWNDVVDKYPDAVMAYNNRALAFVEKKEYNQAIADFSYVLNFVSDADRRGIYLYLIDLYRAAGKKEEAGQIYNKLKEIDAKLPLQNERMQAAGRGAEAVGLYKKALETDPRNVVLLNELGKAYLLAGRFNAAAGEFQKALAVDAGLAAVHNNLALAYYYQKNYPLAVRHCDKAIALGYAVSPKLLDMLKPYREEEIK